MSEDKPVQASAETSAAAAAPGPADPSIDPVVAAALQVANAASPSISPDHEAPPKPDAPKVEAEAEAPRMEAARVEMPKADAAKPDAKAEAPRTPGKIMIMSPSERIRDGEASRSNTGAGQGTQASPRRRVAAMAAVVVLATFAGALGGALATAGISRVIGGGQAAGKGSELDAQVARLDAEISALKLSVEHNAKTDMSQLNKTGERLDRLEKAQAEPAAKLAKLSEAVEKLRAAPNVTAAAPAAAKEATGSIAPQAVAAATPPAAPAAQAAAPKTEVGRLPTVEGWVLRDVGRGSALIESRQGLYEVYAGDPVPGLGRIDAIRRQDGRWVVVTSRGLIVSR